MKERIKLLGPPIPKNRKLSLFDFHKYARSQEIPFAFESSFKPVTDGQESDWSVLERQIEGNFDIGVIASFGKMVPDNIIDAFPQGMLVMHPSLLPKYRGACPIQHAILNQDEFTGTSVIEIAKGVFDAGNILA